MTHSDLETLIGSEHWADLRLAAESAGCEILEARFKSGRFQIVLDHPEGTTLAHCEDVSKKISALLDVTDFGASRYVLEVSSPGLDRKLYGPRDYSRFAGHLARVTWVDPEKGKRTDIGRLATLDGSPAEGAAPADGSTLSHRIALQVSEELAIEVPIDDVVEARLEIEI